MRVPDQFKLKNTIKYPTSIIVGGISKLGLEVAESLVEQGGYVIIIDTVNEESIARLGTFSRNDLVSLLDYSSIPHLEEDIRRLDYVFYFNHEIVDFKNKISTQEFLTFSNYLDAVLTLATKFEAKFLLTSSIKVNQVILSEAELSLGLGSSDKVTHIYTEMETQKYAEGLVMEYGEKAELDVRIIRLGEIIGDEMNFRNLTSFTEFILNAVRGKALELKKDGLENEWYIHLLDAAYALIKAQFGSKTSARIFSASYDTSFSHLAIAYKIQEYSDGKTEIRFIRENDNLPSLKLYKPAKSLSDIGWVPKISFDKAIRESVASAKIFLAEKNIEKIKRNSNASLSSKLMSFLSLANDDSENRLNEDILDTMAREHDNDKKVKKNRLVLGHRDLKKRRRRPKTRKEKFQDIFWAGFTRFANIFTFFRNKSPLEIGALFVSVTLLIFVYFFAFAPFIYLTKNYTTAIQDTEELLDFANEKNYEQLTSKTEKIKIALEDNIDLLSMYEFSSKFITLEDELADIQEINDIYALAISGIIDVSENIDPLNVYLNEFYNNTVLRSGNESYLSINDNGVDFSAELSKVEGNRIYLVSGLEKLDKAIERLNKRDYTHLPEYIATRIVDMNLKLSELKSSLESSYYESYLAELLGATNQKTHLILVLDNTRLSPIGGDISAFALVTFKGGSVVDIVVRPVTDSLEIPTFSNEEIAYLNTNRFSLINATDIELNDFSSLTDFREFAFEMRSVFENEYERDIDGVITLNLNSLSELLSVNQIGPVNVSGLDFNESNFLNSLNNAQVQNENVEVRRDLIAQVLATFLYNEFNSYSNTYSDLVNKITSQLLLDNIYLDFDTSNIQDELDKNYISFAEDTDSYIKVTTLMNDPNNVNISKFSDINIALETSISNELSLSHKATVNFTNLGNGQELAVCLSRNTDPDSVVVSGLTSDSLRYVINEGEDDVCIVMRILSENSVTITWKEFSKFEVNGGETIIQLGVARVKGARTTLDHTIKLGNNLQISNIESDISFVPGSTEVGYNKQILSDQITTLSIR
ncbi:MAG: NAD(P)-dependent oxidoreductase [Candidatus Dojkabacteria bacterium]|nr:NAD(P)-dependent oxidoreductase [Candidatus Dojkabacteria bacterium]MDQ7021678.1 NAD(P)-dependent oxidoreductase [Candidatus Dojkabacteria bacterium]